MQRRFLADVSHELRTPLTVIKGNVWLDPQAGAADEESLESIETEVDRLTRLVGDLLLLAQAESGQVPFDMVPVQLDEVLLEVFQQMRSGWGALESGIKNHRPARGKKATATVSNR